MPNHRFAPRSAKQNLYLYCTRPRDCVKRRSVVLGASLTSPLVVPQFLCRNLSWKLQQSGIAIVISSHARFSPSYLSTNIVHEMSRIACARRVFAERCFRNKTHSNANGHRENYGADTQYTLSSSLGHCGLTLGLDTLRFHECYRLIVPFDAPVKRHLSSLSYTSLSHVRCSCS